MKLVVAVRPYAPRIRLRMFEHMRAADCPILSENIIEAGTSDADAVRVVLAHAASVLLVPFHAHRDDDGNKVDGLSFLTALHRARGTFAWHVIMPVSMFAIPAVTVPFNRGELDAHVRERILLIPEDELDDSATADRIRRHVG